MDKTSPYYRQVALLVRALPWVANESCFALKGGTAINLFIHDFPRLSVDIDLAWIPLESREVALPNVREALTRIAAELKARGQRIDVLLNNAGTMNGTFGLTADGFEQTVGVNCVGTAALTLALLPLMHPGSRIVNTLSCTYRIGRVDGRLFEPDPERYARFRAYGTSKLALLLFSLELRERVARQGIGVFAADPGIVDTNMITMHRWFDPIADLLFRPLIKTPEQGAETALQLACGKLPVSGNSLYWRNGKARRISDSVVNHPCRKHLWKQILQLTTRAIPETETYFRSLKY